jgi:hypothetical protein
MTDTYAATEHLNTPSGDTPDHTNVTIQLEAPPPQPPYQQQQGSNTCGSWLASALSRSTTVRYLLVVIILAVFIFLLEHVLGGAVPQELRNALLDSVKEALGQAGLSVGGTPKPLAQ